MPVQLRPPRATFLVRANVGAKTDTKKPAPAYPMATEAGGEKGNDMRKLIVAAVLLAMASPAWGKDYGPSRWHPTPSTPTCGEPYDSRVLCFTDENGYLKATNIDDDWTVTMGDGDSIVNAHVRGCLAVLPGTHPRIVNSIFECGRPPPSPSTPTNAPQATPP